MTISRFARDRAVFEFIGRHVLPELAERALARGSAALRCWSAGCGCGEEPYGLAILWQLGPGPRFAPLALRVTATDVDPRLLERARRGWYEPSALRDLPAAWREAAFSAGDGRLRLDDRFRGCVELHLQDLRREAPPGPFDLVLCRNLAFTYFDEDLQRETLARLLARLRPGGALVIGVHETLPAGAEGVAPWSARLGIHRRVEGRQPG